MLLHINPTRQRGKSLARASGWYMTFFAAGVIAVTPWIRSSQRLGPAPGRHGGTEAYRLPREATARALWALRFVG
jgi:hypothetical protein